MLSMLKPTHYKSGLSTMLVQKLKARENDCQPENKTITTSSRKQVS